MTERDWEYCYYECIIYDDDYYVDENGEPVCACDTCWNNGMSGMTGLKPCPFCGGEADCNNSGFMKAGNFMWGVECLGCGTTTDLFDTEAAAIEAWNRRINDG